MSARDSKSGFSVCCCSAFAWVDRSGRGFNPRPAQVTGSITSERKTPDRKASSPLNVRPRFQIWVFCFLLLCFRVGGSFRSGVQPPTGSITSDRKAPPTPNASLQFQIRKASPEMNLLTVFCPLLLCPRVGGSFRSGVQPPTGSRPAQGRGLNPRLALAGSKSAQGRLKRRVSFRRPGRGARQPCPGRQLLIPTQSTVR